MQRRLTALLPCVPALALALLASGCATTATVVPGKTLALIDVQYPEGRFTGVPMGTGEETPTVRVGRALLRELTREGLYEVRDVRGLRVRPADLGKDAAKTALLRRESPADAYLGVRLLDCAARPMSATETRGSGASAVTVTVYWFLGECDAEMTAFDADGKTLAILQKTGRWESPRQDRADGEAMQSQALTSAVDDVARRIAREVRPTAPAKK